jgi:hypothetical protein
MAPLGVRSSGPMPPAAVAPAAATPAAGTPAAAASAGVTPSADPGARAPVNVSTTGGSDTVVGGAAGAIGSSSPPAATPSPRIAALQGVTDVPSGRPTQSDGPVPHAVATLVGPSDIKVGDEFTVTLQLQTDQNIARVRSQVRFDGVAFQLLTGDPGSLVPEAAGAKVIGRAGGAQRDVTLPSDTPISGSGDLMVLHFKAVQARAQTAFAAQVTVMGGSGAIMGSSTPTPLTFAVTN